MNYADRVKDTTTTTGTGTVTLSGSAAPGFRTFASAFSAGAAEIPYCIVGPDGAAWEIGLGTLATGTTLVRNTVLESSNAGALVNFGAGSKDVFVTLASSQIAKFMTIDTVAFSQTVPLSTGGTRYMSQTTVTGALTFAPSASPVRGSLVYLRLVADGINVPDFTAFAEWGGSLGWDNTAGITNQVQFFYDGSDAWCSVSQAVGAAPQINVTGTTLAGPSSGVVSTASSNFTVGVTPSGGTLAQDPTVVTPSDGGAGGSFTPSTVNLTNASKSATFTYTPVSTGAKTISVTNNAGLTNPSSIAYTSNAAATVPGAPTIGTATAGDASASVTFTAPASDGGSAITGYTVTSSPGGLTGAGSASPITVTGLTNGTAYTFTVTATNSVGTSSASAASNSVTPQAAVSTRMLDGLASSAVAAYSVARKLRTAYSGSAIRVRDTNSTFTDIGFDGNGEVDMTALAAAVAAAPGNNLYIATIYDQSGNGFDVTQSTNGNQWLVVSSGVNRTLGGKLTWKPEGYAPGSLSTAAISATLGAAAAVASGNTQTSGAGIVSGAGGNSTDPLYAPSATGGALAGRYNNVAAATLEVNGALASTMPTTGANALYSDGEPRAVTGIKLGVDSGNAGGWNGNISEVVLWAAALSSGDQTAVYNSQKAFYGTP